MTRRRIVAALIILAGLGAMTLTPALGNGAARLAGSEQVAPGDPLAPLSPTTVPPSPVPVDPGLLTPGIPQQVTVRVGDSVLVDGAGLGCQITRRSGRIFIECRRAGDVARTYMTLIGERKVMVARFRSADTAKVILTATHGAGWRACRTAATAALVARAGGRRCR